jgi:hypothetical protein
MAFYTKITLKIDGVSFWFNLYNFKGIGIASGYRSDGQVSILSKGRIFLFSTAYRLARGRTQPFIHWVSGTFSPRGKLVGDEADSCLHLMERSRMVAPYLHSASALHKF